MNLLPLSRRRLAPRRLVVVLVLVLVPPISLAAERDPDYDYDPPAPGTYTLPVIKPAAAGALLDSSGKSLDLRDLTRGRVTVLEPAKLRNYIY